MWHLSPSQGARLLPFLLAFSPSTVADDSAATTYPVQVNDTECDCFQTLGANTNYFANHQFWDFRSLKDQYVGIPPIKTSLDAAHDANETSSFFTSDRWTSTWALQNWNNSGANPFGGADYMMMNSFSNVYIDLNGDSTGDDVSDTYLVLRTTKLKDFQSAAEFQTQDQDFQFLSMRMYARTAGDPGACTAMFTYRENDNIYKVQEADIEILTSGPDDVLQFTNQPSYTANGDTIDDSTQNVTIPASKTWADWRQYRLDWSEGVSSWYVDGQHVSTITFQAPRDPSSLIMNAWGDGGAWTGIMAEGGQAFLQVQWFEIVYNKTSDGGNSKRDLEEGAGDDEGLLSRFVKRGKSKKCAKVCSIDEIQNRGTPMLLYDSPAPVLRIGVAGWVVPTVLGVGLALLL